MVKARTGYPPEYLIPICEFFDISLIWLLTGNSANYSDKVDKKKREWLDLYEELCECPEIYKQECIGFVKGYIARGKH